MAKYIGTGLLLALQFFSVFPIRKNLPMERQHVTAMYIQLPVIGMLMGGVLATVAFLLRDATDASSLLVGFLMTLLSIAMTGGLHLDGLADSADAYFSYQEKERRLEIMGDPRIGAFGAIALILTITGKIVIISETVLSVSVWMILLLPIISRIGLLLLFTLTSTSKNSGLAAFFRKKANLSMITAFALAWIVIVAAAIIILAGWQNGIALLVAFLIASFLYRLWCNKNFGGVTGDLFGAYVEGIELLLWIMILFFI
ncbi:adenosylcobinamide-GDP ribazoletransferase [Planococcus halotolerans]|uniref:adenosylcobinamide-GDP ribazoletransferase n=1 Tax=Planococcus halotolerans TaxID=2233542 RepID=UPI0010930C39|nr:adenosylcobinamide-GDP ribazoletransferase [Planococcus halotolerans]QHJ70461.1 adenosylcobinamide-GDP ribazoletransferase [Planococcus halotolerans]